MPSPPEAALPSLPATGPALLMRALRKRSGATAHGTADAPIASEFFLPNLDPHRLARYNALLGFAPGAIPVTYHYLAMQRAHLATMLAPAFPFRLLGMIHAEVDIVEHARPDPRAPASIATAITIAEENAAGAVYCTLSSTLTQCGAGVVSSTNRYLARRGRSGGKANAEEMSNPGGPTAQWEAPFNAGRRYAAVSGDWNPIHLWGWSARLFGLSAPIIHGMHTVGMTCAQIETSQHGRAAQISARFRAPIVLGSRASLELDQAATPPSWRVTCGGKLAAQGSYRLASD